MVTSAAADKIDQAVQLSRIGHHRNPTRIEIDPRPSSFIGAVFLCLVAGD
jgi:hypothetical protein